MWVVQRLKGVPGFFLGGRIFISSDFGAKEDAAWEGTEPPQKSFSFRL